MELSMFLNSGLTIIPNINLINNIGFDADATHTKNDSYFTKNKELELEESGIFPLIHPQQITISKLADEKIEFLIYSGYPKFSLKSFKKNANKLTSKFKFLLINKKNYLKKFKL